MAKSDVEVVIVGGGAAGIAAGRHLHDAGVDCLIVEARTRLGGRAWTDTETVGHALDLGCGWLHSANKNPWHRIAREQGRAIEKTPPPWYRPSLEIGFPKKDQKEFAAALSAFHERMRSYPEEKPDAPASALLAPGCDWNELIGAVTTYLSGTEPAHVSVRDFANYDDTLVNWRVVEGYGATVASHADGVPVKLGCPVGKIDWSGKRTAVHTPDGTIACDVVIVTLPTDLLAAETVRFEPALPQKTELAASLPLGLADKLFLGLEHANEFEKDSRLFGRTDRTATGAYHIRPFGRSEIEAYFGGSLARDLEAEGDAAFLDFALAELTALLGSDFARRISPLRVHRWGADPYSRGSYSSALPGKSENRALLAEPVADRLFFAGEACSPDHYSTAQGGYLTGIEAAEKVIMIRPRIGTAKSH
jgi:monoamine oxidase